MELGCVPLSVYASMEPYLTFRITTRLRTCNSYLYRLISERQRYKRDFERLYEALTAASLSPEEQLKFIDFALDVRLPLSVVFDVISRNNVWSVDEIHYFVHVIKYSKDRARRNLARHYSNYLIHRIPPQYDLLEYNMLVAMHDHRSLLKESIYGPRTAYKAILIGISMRENSWRAACVLDELFIWSLPYPPKRIAKRCAYEWLELGKRHFLNVLCEQTKNSLDWESIWDAYKTLHEMKPSDFYALDFSVLLVKVRNLLRFPLSPRLVWLISTFKITREQLGVSDRRDLVISKCFDANNKFI